ncbi:hypothetical protein KAT80_02470 [Candidatus Pacearchaeota archaeon]|nr:hypothetical protein [Candidatus Pacearchaeota archaeon]
MVIKEKIFIGLLILVIVLSVGSIVFTQNLNSEDSQVMNVVNTLKGTSEEDVQSGNLNLLIVETAKNSEVNE